MLKKFTQVESLASTQSRQKQQLASNIGYHTAPQDQERVGGYQPPPSYASYEPPRHAGQLPAPEATFIFPLFSLLPAPQIPPPMQQKAPAPPPPSSGPRYVAIYDYTAADDDEVTFQEGQNGT